MNYNASLAYGASARSTSGSQYLVRLLEDTIIVLFLHS